MTHLEQAIKDAQRVGYKLYDSNGRDEISDVVWYTKDWKAGQAQLLLDPAFWQALGKARGWELWEGWDEECPECHWKALWHRLIDHLADGKDVESFFEML